MAYQAIFKRYEIKYMLSRRQQEQLIRVMQPYMALDKFGHTTIRNIYFDTDTYRLIRHSLEKPSYKEKLRIRSYSRAEHNSPVFVELKKKYRSVVYKRRISMPEHEAIDWLLNGTSHPVDSQIAQEIDYFKDFYETLHPAVFLSYERDAYYSLAGDDFRVTFDQNILSREVDLSLESEVWGTPLLGKDQVLLEIKTPGAIPLWMTHFLTEQKIYKTSFSKYGTAYNNIILEREFGGHLYA